MLKCCVFVTWKYSYINYISIIITKGIQRRNNSLTRLRLDLKQVKLQYSGPMTYFLYVATVCDDPWCPLDVC